MKQGAVDEQRGVAASALCPLQGSASESTCLLDYSFGVLDQPSLDLFFSPFKDKDLF